MTVPPLAQLYVPLPAAGRMASRVDLLFTALLVTALVIVVALTTVALVFLFRYRQGSPAPRPPLRLREWKLETAWITGTTVIFVGIFVWGAALYLDMGRPPRDATDIDIVGRQWMWDVRQPDGRREFNTLHVPAGRPIRLRMSSEDVIHSLFIPALRLKQDLVPGRRTETWFEASRPGTYHLFCAQYCGTSHAAMIGTVIVQTPEEYAAWRSRGVEGNPLSDRGRAVFIRYGCAGCHTPGSSVRAPSLEGRYGHAVPLADGSMARFDESYIRDALLEPRKQVAAGYDPVMPSYKGVVSEGELLELTRYLKALGASVPPPAIVSPAR